MHQQAVRNLCKQTRRKYITQPVVNRGHWSLIWIFIRIKFKKFIMKWKLNVAIFSWLQKVFLFTYDILMHWKVANNWECFWRCIIIVDKLNFHHVITNHLWCMAYICISIFGSLRHTDQFKNIERWIIFLYFSKCFQLL